MKSSASIYESSGLQFFRTTTGIQSGPDIFDKLRFGTTFLTIVRDTEKLYSFRLVLEGKTSKEILESSRLEFLEGFLANNFTLSDEEDNTSRLLSRGGMAFDQNFSSGGKCYHQKKQINQKEQDCKNHSQ